MTPDPVLEAGFADPVLDGQNAFRCVLEAMARPGSLQALTGLPPAPAPLSPVAAAVALTLVDHDTPLWLDPALAASRPLHAWLAFHTGAPIVESQAEAGFALIAEPPSMPALDSFSLGSEAYPDRSTTLILQVQAFGDEGPLLSGPGLAEPLRFDAAPLPETFWAQFRGNRALFPRGVDVILAGPEALAALPRSLEVEAD